MDNALDRPPRIPGISGSGRLRAQGSARGGGTGGIDNIASRSAGLPWVAKVRILEDRLRATPEIDSVNDFQLLPGTEVAGKNGN